ncbi:MAG: hypothetical protein DMG59_01685 [Acidobacteria bacterium]|nr:MAG: hypothetical protein DMG59_01685 [Acidobacteriota bacterium]
MPSKALMTRRDAILIGLTFPAGIAFPASSKDFWNEKPPAEWTPDEIQQLLTKSPWAKEASVSYNAGPGGMGGGRSGRSRGGMGGMGGRGGIGGIGGMGGGGRGPSGGSNGGSSMPGQYHAVARWESALPIREATKNKSMQGVAENYVINLIGDLPNMARRGSDEDESERMQRLEMLKEYTKLDRKGDPIYLSNVLPSTNNAGTLFYFPNFEPIKPEDKQVTFVTKMGPIEVKAKFSLKEMVYHGSLAL